MNSAAATTFDLDFYSNPACASRPQEFLEGQEYIGSTQVTTDGSGNARLRRDAAGDRRERRADQRDGHGPERQHVRVLAAAGLFFESGGGPSAGGTNFTLAGMLFENGATVTVGGAPATNVNVASSDVPHGDLAGAGGRDP